MMAAAGGARVVIVTVQLPDDRSPHEGPTYDVLRVGADAVPRYVSLAAAL